MTLVRRINPESTLSSHSSTKRNAMFETKVESIFESNYKKIMRRRPHLEPAFKEALDEMTATGTAPASCNPHPLAKQSGSHTGHVDLHLSDGEIDVIVLYMPHKTNPAIKLVRMGSRKVLMI